MSARYSPPLSDKNKKNTTTVLVFGVFDFLHPGHKYFLRQAQKYGRQLYVIIARDKIVQQTKGQRPVNNQRQRLNKVRQLPYVVHARLGDASVKHHYHMIKLIKPDVICLGYDQKISLPQLRNSLKRLGLTPKLVRIKSFKPKQYKSSLIKLKLKQSYNY